MTQIARGIAAAALAAIAVMLFRNRPVARPATEGSWEPADR